MKRYSINDEDYIFDSVAEVVDDMLNDGEGDPLGRTYYELDVKPLDAESFISVHRFIDDLQDQLYEEVGEASDMFSAITKEAQAELKDALVAWARKHTNLETFWVGVGKAREMKITEADL